MNRFLITGGSGLLGSALTKKLLKQGNEVVHLSRSPSKKSIAPSFYWDVEKMEIDEKAFDGVDHIIHLAGANISDGKWSKHVKEEIIRSRTDSAELLRKTLEKKKHEIEIKSIVCASAIGFYGNRGEELLTESSEKGEDFLADVCDQWETASKKLAVFAQSFNIVRIGIVLSKNGGALPKMIMTKPLGVLSYFGNGQQYYSWIHIDDLVSLIIFLLENSSDQLTYNAVAPNPLTNKEFMETISSLSRRNILIGVPQIALQLAMGEMSSIVLNSNKVSSEAIQNSGFKFSYNNLESALKSLL